MASYPDYITAFFIKAHPRSKFSKITLPIIFSISFASLECGAKYALSVLFILAFKGYLHVTWANGPANFFTTL